MKQESRNFVTSEVGIYKRKKYDLKTLFFSFSEVFVTFFLGQDLFSFFFLGQDCTFSIFSLNLTFVLGRKRVILILFFSWNLSFRNSLLILLTLVIAQTLIQSTWHKDIYTDAKTCLQTKQTNIYAHQFFPSSWKKK